MSLDQGLTWGVPVDVKNVLTYTWVAVPDDKLVLWRVNAYDSGTPQQVVINAWSGTWFDGRKLPLTVASGLRQ